LQNQYKMNDEEYNNLIATKCKKSDKGKLITLMIHEDGAEENIFECHELCTYGLHMAMTFEEKAYPTCVTKGFINKNSLYQQRRNDSPDKYTPIILK